MPPLYNPTATPASVTAVAFTANLAYDESIRSGDSQPLGHNYFGWTYDPDVSQGATLLATASSTLNLIRIRALSSLITNAHLHFTVAGSGLTGVYGGLYSSAGALLAGSQSLDRSSDWLSGGPKTIPFGTPQAVTAGSYYYFGFFAVGTTMPTISRSLNSSSAIVNINLTAPNLRYATTADTGLTTTLPANFGAQTGMATAFWAGIS
jgi:hypothetical protein